MKKHIKSQKFVLGIDLGGTKILAALVDHRGKIIGRFQCPTEAERGKTRVIGNIIGSIGTILKDTGMSMSRISCIGIGAPGPISLDKGVIYNPPNLPGWEKVPLKDILRKELKKPVLLCNDADAAALAEATFGIGKGVRNFVYVTVSTGIGGGIVIDGKLLTGLVGGAGEIGHMVIKDGGPRCGCGKSGCLEALASGSALARRARDEISKGARSLLSDIVGGDLQGITAETVERAAREGDKLACDLVNECSRYLGIGLSNIINILSPDMIALGGGVTNMGDIFTGPAIKVAKELALSPAREHIRIVPAKLKRDVGVLGAASLCL